MPIEFDQPVFLWLLGLIIPFTLLGWRAMLGQDRLRTITALVLRCLLITALSTLLARPSIVREHHHLTVIGLVDVSPSVRRFGEPLLQPGAEGRSLIESVRAWFRDAVETRQEDDRVGLIVFDGQAVAIATPTRGDYLDDNMDLTWLPGTNIEDAIRLGLAMFPSDTAKRLVLVSDGNETQGQALRAAQLAAAGANAPIGADVDADELAAAPEDGSAIPIDVLPIDYLAPGDVRIDRIEAPPSAQPGQTITVRVRLHGHYPAPPRSEADLVTGELFLTHEGIPVDLNGSAPGNGRAMTLQPGPTIELITVELGETPVNRFEAEFVPDDPASDVLFSNNTAEAFTATPAKGAILIVDAASPPSNDPLTSWLTGAALPFNLATPGEIPSDLLALQRYDLVILRNIAAYELPTEQHEMLASYVNDLGGGLIMTGGEKSFGAGGWKKTAIADILPVDLDPPRELRLPTSALVLVLDKSGSMAQPVAGARASQQEVANEGAALAVESLRDDTIIGVVTFDFGARRHVEMQRNVDPAAISERIRAIQPEGGTNMGPALVAARAMLNSVDVDRKRIVCLSDGQSEGANFEAIAEACRADGIRITTIAVGDDADHELLEQIAAISDGEFYPVRNPKSLPRVLVDSVQVINKPLVKEGRFTPAILPTGSTLTSGFDASLILEGLIVTGPKFDPGIMLEMTHPDGEPLLARWQVGLGRVAAFTSDVGGEWSEDWNDSTVAAQFWTQLVRTTSRAPSSRDAELNTWIEGGRMIIQLEANENTTGIDESSFLTVRGNVYAPDGSTLPVRLTQVSPTRYQAEVDAREPGNYIVALAPKRGERALTPVIGGVSQNSDPEFERYQSDTRLLNEIQSTTGGRRLDLADPQSVALFDRDGMPRSRSLLPFIEPLMILVIVGLLLDIASRRIAWSSRTLVRLVNIAMRKEAPGHRRHAARAATLEGLQRVTSASRSTRQQSEADQPAPTARVPRAVRRKTPAATPDLKVQTNEKDRPDDDAVRSALDRLSGRGSSKPDKTSKPTQSKPPAETPGNNDGGDDDSTTSSLLEAKRRARRRLGDE